MLTLTISTAFLCALAALAGGFIDAIAGGGGLLTLPTLLLCGIPPHITLGTNKLAAFLGTSVSLYRYAASHLVCWRIVLAGLFFSFLGSWLGSLIAHNLDAELLGKVIVVLIPFAMIGTLLPQKKKPAANAAVSGWKLWVAIPLFCLFMGCYDGFFGPGTGSFLILGLHWLFRMDLLGASGTAKAFNLASNLSSAVYFIFNGLIFWELGLVMAACLMVGNWCGATFAIHVGPKAVRRFLLISLFILLGSLVWKYFITPLLQ